MKYYKVLSIRDLRIFIFAIFCFCQLIGYAQKHNFPQHYFLFPINPGQRNTLAGVLGDLRTNHFHAGIDVRTQQREGLEVLASADGYISRIVVQTSGYGNVLYIKHPNGMTTVYAHLKTFAEPVGSFVRQKQYERQTFDIELSPTPNQFPVRKGQLIALSGNTGSSAGPHLHFEIRDAQNNYINPLFFGFSEIIDNAPPYFNSLAIKPMQLESRVNGTFDRILFNPVRQKDGSYTLTQPVKAWGELGLELRAYDAMTGVSFRNGVNCVEIKMDGEEVFAYNMTTFPNWTTRDYNHIINYANEQLTGVRFLKCYNPDGNQFDLFKTDNFRGKLQINDTLTHEVEIKLFDSYENSSVLRFMVKGEKPIAPLMPIAESDMIEGLAYIKTDILENTLKISALGGSMLSKASVFVKNNVLKLMPAYQTQEETVYLLDLREHFPDSIIIANKTLRTYFKTRIAPNKIDTYAKENYVIRFGNQSVFDTLYLAVQTYSNGLNINEETIPLRDAIGVNFTPSYTPALREKTHIYRMSDGKLRYIGGRWQGNTIDFTTRELGSFILATDTIPPSVRILRSDKNIISARIDDDESGVAQFSMHLNDEWVLMNYDSKRNYIWSEKLVDSTDFEGTFELKVTDRAGNITLIQDEIKEVVAKPVAVRNKSKSKKPVSKSKKKTRRR